VNILFNPGFRASTDPLCRAARRSGNRLRLRRRDPVKDLLLDGPDPGDFGCELVDALPHRKESGWSSGKGFFFRLAGLPDDLSLSFVKTRFYKNLYYALAKGRGDFS